MSIFPTITLVRHGNGWIYTIQGRYEEHQGVCPDDRPLVLRFYVEGLGKTLTLRVGEEP